MPKRRLVCWLPAKDILPKLQLIDEPLTFAAHVEVVAVCHVMIGVGHNQKCKVASCNGEVTVHL